MYTLIEIRTHDISGDKHWLHRLSCKFNYHTITANDGPSLSQSMGISQEETLSKILSHFGINKWYERLHNIEMLDLVIAAWELPFCLSY
jgi:hypothetical protein